MNDMTRLQWRCRRGTREMDLLFECFLANSYPGLSASQKQVFESLLEETDPDIQDWINGKTEPRDPAYRELISLFGRTGTRKN